MATSTAARGKIQVANEFTIVQLEYVRTGAGERVRVTSPRLGFSIDLDPMQLESLTWQDPNTFSELLNDPYGPGHEMDARPLSDLFTDKE